MEPEFVKQRDALIISFPEWYSLSLRWDHRLNFWKYWRVLRGSDDSQIVWWLKLLITVPVTVFSSLYMYTWCILWRVEVCTYSCNRANTTDEQMESFRTLLSLSLSLSHTHTHTHGTDIPTYWIQHVISSSSIQNSLEKNGGIFHWALLKVLFFIWYYVSWNILNWDNAINLGLAELRH
jgi:hypothetical protein